MHAADRGDRMVVIASISGVAVDRSSVSNGSQTAAGWVLVNRTATVSRPASGAGTPSSAGRRSSAIEVLACSGSVRVHALQARSTRSASAPSKYSAPP
jgi:hypothetical protein